MPRFRPRSDREWDRRDNNKDDWGSRRGDNNNTTRSEQSRESNPQNNGNGEVDEQKLEDKMPKFKPPEGPVSIFRFVF